MKKVPLLLATSLALAGCDNSITTKEIKDLTPDEVVSLCSLDEHKTKLVENFKQHSREHLHNNPQYLNPLADANIEISGVNTNKSSVIHRDNGISQQFVMNDESFDRSFDKANPVEIIDISGNAYNDSIGCSANLTYSPDFLYAKKIEIPIQYKIEKNNNEFTFKSDKIILPYEREYYKDIDPSESQKEWLNAYVKEKKDYLAKLRSASDEEYIPISEEDIVYLYFANSGREFSDDEYMGVFSAKWNNTVDTFEKEDIKKAELQSIKDKVQSYKGVSKIKLLPHIIYPTNDKTKGIDGSNAITIMDQGASIVTRTPYDLEKKGFEYINYLCRANGGIYLSNRGIYFNIETSIRECLLKVPEDQARSISKTFAEHKDNTSSEVTYYVQISDYLPDNRINGILIKEHLDLYNNHYSKDEKKLFFSGEIN
ncbi:hypothetical protein AB7W23_21485 [Providencia rettgeri]|uniref:hypothetical protein n=1 Tax=Providencia sp. PROV089 TaxID=2949805 RepID=UPI0023499D6A|nr:hypothetical protein [Providencia sp. PROV089]